MRQSKVTKVSGVPRSLGEAGPVTRKRNAAKLKPAEFAMLMQEMSSTPAKPRVQKRTTPLRKKHSPVVPPQDVNVVCTPWYTICLSRRMSFFVGLWVGVLTMGILSLLAWGVIKAQPVFSANASLLQIGTPSTVSQENS